MDKIKKYIDWFLTEWAVPLAFSLAVTGIICFGFEWYTSSRTEHEYQHVNKSVADVEAGIKQAESGVGSAKKEVDHAQQHIQRAKTVTRTITKRAERNGKELTECEQLADSMSERSERIGKIIRDVEAGNPGTRTQAESTAPAAGCMGGGVHDAGDVHIDP